MIRAQRDTLFSVNHRLIIREDSISLLRKQVDSLQNRISGMELQASYPGYYLIIDTYQNRFHLRYGDLLVRSGYCATGKGWTENDGGIVWDFSTPRALHSVIRKGENPYWYRPSWYWLERDIRPPRLEEVIEIPDSISWDDQIAYYNDSLTPGERMYVVKVPGALGNYKIDLGGGVLLHYGIGRGWNVSHGCVRLGNADLEVIYRALPVGAPVVIY